MNQVMRAAIVILILCLWSASTWAQSIWLGPGIFFYEPGEIAGAAGKKLPLTARPLFSARSELWRFQPEVALLFPHSNSDRIWSWTGFLNADYVLKASSKFSLLAGPSLQWSLLHSRGRNVEQNGSFVTPGGASLGWLFAFHSGVGFQLDSRLRLDGGAFIMRPLSALLRKYRFALTVSYAI